MEDHFLCVSKLYDTYYKQDLKDQCKILGLNISGNKEVLCNRIIEELIDIQPLIINKKQRGFRKEKLLFAKCIFRYIQINIY